MLFRSIILSYYSVTHVHVPGTKSRLRFSSAPTLIVGAQERVYNHTRQRSNIIFIVIILDHTNNYYQQFCIKFF